MKPLNGRRFLVALPVRFFKAKLTAGPPVGAFQDSWKSPVVGSAANVDDDNSGWKFPELLVTSEALAAEMLSESMTISASSSAHVDQYGDSSRGGGGGGGGGAAGRRYKRSSAMPTPPPPEFRLSTGDINRHRFVGFEPAGWSICGSCACAADPALLRNVRTYLGDAGIAAYM